MHSAKRALVTPSLPQTPTPWSQDSQAIVGMAAPYLPLRMPPGHTMQAIAACTYIHCEGCTGGIMQKNLKDYYSSGGLGITFRGYNLLATANLI